MLVTFHDFSVLTLNEEYCMSARTQCPYPEAKVDFSHSSAWLREAIDVLLANTVRMNLPGRKVSRTRVIIWGVYSNG